MGNRLKLRKIYEKEAQEYSMEKQFSHYQGYRERMHTTLGTLDLTLGLKVLDVGCGDGVYAAEVAKRGCFVLGLDVAIGRARRAKNRAARMGVKEQTEYLVCDAEALPIRDRLLDRVICAEVLEHLFDPQKVLYEASRVLSPRGSIVISIPNALSPNTLIDHFERKVYGALKKILHINPTTLRFHRLITQRAIHVMLNNAKMKITEKKTCVIEFHAPFQLISIPCYKRSLRISWVPMRARKAMTRVMKIFEKKYSSHRALKLAMGSTLILKAILRNSSVSQCKQ